MRRILAACTLVAALSPIGFATAVAQQTVKFAFLADPSRDAILWAYKNGKVKSDKIKIETSGLSVPALTQAMSSRQFQVVEVSPFAIPAGAQRGLNLKVIGIALRPRDPDGGYELWVKSDSAIKTPEDLIGKQVALYSLRSVLAAVLYTSLGDISKVDLKQIQFVEMPAPAMPAALASGRVAAASLIHAQAYQAKKSGEFRLLYPAGAIFKKAEGMHLPTSLLAAYPEALAGDPAIYHEFLRVLKESRDYAIAHPKEVFPAVGKETNMEPEFFDVWFRDFAEFAVDLVPSDLTALDRFFQLAKANKWIDGYPPVASVVWEAVAPKSGK